MNRACAAALGIEYADPTSREPVILAPLYRISLECELRIGGYILPAGRYTAEEIDAFIQKHGSSEDKFG